MIALFSLTHCKNETTQQTAKKVFHYNQINPITSLDPAFARNQAIMWAVDHLYNGLVYLDDSLNIIPSLAKRWQISDDGLQYTFHLQIVFFFTITPVFRTAKGEK